MEFAFRSAVLFDFAIDYILLSPILKKIHLDFVFRFMKSVLQFARRAISTYIHQPRPSATGSLVNITVI